MFSTCKSAEGEGGRLLVELERKQEGERPGCLVRGGGERRGVEGSTEMGCSAFSRKPGIRSRLGADCKESRPVHFEVVMGFCF